MTARSNKPSRSQSSAFDAALASAQPRRTRREAGPPRAFKDDRMPAIGTILESRPVKGKVVKVEVCDGYVKPRSRKPNGKAFSATTYKSLSAVMREARGMPSNGWFWFGLGEMRHGELINKAGEPTRNPKPATAKPKFEGPTHRYTCHGCGKRRMCVTVDDRHLCQTCCEEG